jgi:hypothetical protein
MLERGLLLPRKTRMGRALFVLIWISLVIGTYVTGNVLANWAVCLCGLYLFIRSRRRRQSPLATGGPAGMQPPDSRRPASVAAFAVPHARAERLRTRRWR